MLFWKQFRWSWQQILEKEINKIRENSVLQPQTAAKNTASEAGMIHDDCAFSLQRQFFNIVIFLILTAYYRDFHFGNRMSSNDNTACRKHNLGHSNFVTVLIS